MRYAIVIEKSSSGFGAYVPDLPGCVAVADTLEETERLIRESIEFHIEGLREDGIEIPEPSNPIQLYFSRSLIWHKDAKNRHLCFADDADLHFEVLFNDFPEERCCTLYVNGEKIRDFDDWPPAWKRKWAGEAP